MAALNPLTRELVFKVVFYGPGLGGKTTTLQHIHASSKPEHRGNMVSLATDTDRTLYFDFLPLQVLKLRNMSVRLQLFTVPGQVYYTATRKLVLTGADGIVFVADSQSARLDANQESLDDLNANLAEHGRALSRIPHTFQWNKRDLPDVVPTADLDRRLNLFSAPAVETVATSGAGIFAGLEAITRAVFNAYRAELPKGPHAKRESLPVFLDAEEVGLADAIRELADSRPGVSPAPPAIPEGVPSGARALESARGPEAASEPRMRAAQPAMPPSRVASPPPPGAAPVPQPRVPSSPRLSPAPSPSPSPSPGTRPTPVPRAPSPASAQARPPASAPGRPPASAPALARTPPSAPARTPAAAHPPAPAAPSAPAPPTGASGPGTPTLAPSSSSSQFSLAALWPAEDRESVQRVETLIAARDPASAVVACEALVTRMLAEASIMLGAADQPRDPAVLALLLGIDGPRYVAFRVAVRSARAQKDVPSRDAVDAYLLALDMRRALDAVGR